MFTVVSKLAAAKLRTFRVGTDRQFSFALPAIYWFFITRINRVCMTAVTIIIIFSLFLIRTSAVATGTLLPMFINTSFICVRIINVIFSGDVLSINSICFGRKYSYKSKEVSLEFCLTQLHLQEHTILQYWMRNPPRDVADSKHRLLLKELFIPTLCPICVAFKTKTIHPPLKRKLSFLFVETIHFDVLGFFFHTRKIIVRWVNARSLTNALLQFLFYDLFHC